MEVIVQVIAHRIPLLLATLCIAACGSSNDGPVGDFAPWADLAGDAGGPDAMPPDLQLPEEGGTPDGSPDGAVSVPLPGFGTISGQCGVLDDAEWNASSPFFFRNAIDFGSASFDAAQLSTGGQQVWNDGNLGGSSELSEVFAYEMLYRCELAALLKTETKISYTDAGGKKTDLLTEIDARKIGVSVTRAYHYPPTNPYTEAEAKALLDKKLADLPLSQANATAADAWVRSILHVFAYDAQYADAVQSAWNTQVDAAVKGDAILILTVTDGNDGDIY
jgi:hypothetical protein